MCRGYVVNGKCQKCHLDIFNPIPTYAFKVMMAQSDNDTETFGVNVSDNGGKALFGKSPQQFYDLSNGDKKQAIEKVLCALINVDMVVDYKPANGDLFTSIYDVEFVAH